MDRRTAILGGIAAASAAKVPAPALARPTGVNKPEFLPKGPVVNVIDLVGLLTKSQVEELNRNIEKIDKLFGVKLRILCQQYPTTPGEAIVDYWGVDADTIVLVVDDTFPNLLNFNVGSNVEILAPNGRFWTQLRTTYGIQSFIRKNGEDQAVLQAVEAVLDGLTNPNEMGSSIMLNV